MNQVFQHDPNTQELQPGGPLLINLLFKEPVELPDTQRVADVCRKHFGNVECREGDDKSVFITAGEMEVKAWTYRKGWKIGRAHV